MADVHNKKLRSEIMSRIRSKNTSPERLIRKLLHSKGYRFRLNDKGLPGKPDIKLTKYNALIQVNGCFWHGHDCHYFTPPKSNQIYWIEKIKRNKERDAENLQKVLKNDWRLLVVWECAITGKKKKNEDELIAEIEGWILSSEQYLEISG